MINNAIYESLGDRWYGVQDDPVALLRAESAVRNPWVSAVIREKLGPSRAPGSIEVLDIGCGGGFLSNALAVDGFSVTGVDLSQESLRVARQYDRTKKARYLEADARELPFVAGSFDVVCAMDFLEHVEDYARVLGEAARVLRPGGLFFFHTFDRNPLSWLIAIKGVEWFVKNTPVHLHVYSMFIRPRELLATCKAAGLESGELRGLRPVLNMAFLKLLATRVVPRDFVFTFSRSTVIGYSGYARKPPERTGIL